MDEQKIAKKLKDEYPLDICICGKQFIHTGEWVYKLHKNGKNVYYCSYTCWRKAGGGKKSVTFVKHRRDL